MKKTTINKVSTLGVVAAIFTLVLFSNPLKSLEQVGATYWYGYWYGYGSSPNSSKFQVANDPRVKTGDEIYQTDTSKDNKPSGNDNNGKTPSTNVENEDSNRVNVTLDNWNKFSHKKLDCEFLTNTSNLNFGDVRADSKYYGDILELKNTGITVWTTPNTFEPGRYITKSELLWMALKLNCIDIKSTNIDLTSSKIKAWQLNVMRSGYENKVVDKIDFSVNENITKYEAYNILLKGGEIETPKTDVVEAMKYIWAVDEKEQVYSNSNLKREEAAEVLANVLKIYQMKK